MIRLLFRTLPIAILVYGIYHSSDRARNVFRTAKNMTLQVRVMMNMSNMAKGLKPLVASGEALPYDFQQYLRDNLRSGAADPSLDPWQTPYRIERREGSVFIVSCGPDLECSTKDDIENAISGPASVRRSPW